MLDCCESFFILLIISPIKVPPFTFLFLSPFLCIPITFIKFILSFNNKIGHPDEPHSVAILCSYSNSFIFIIFPLEHFALFPKGYSMVNTSASL